MYVYVTYMYVYVTFTSSLKERSNVVDLSFKRDFKEEPRLREQDYRAVNYSAVSSTSGYRNRIVLPRVLAYRPNNRVINRTKIKAEILAVLMNYDAL